jgi:Glycosyl transferase family 2
VGRSDLGLERSEVNLGTVGGRHRAVGLVDTELVLFLDDDAELLPGALDHLLADLDAHPTAAAVTATVVSADGLVMHSGGSLVRTDGLVTFGLIAAGAEFGRDELPPSGPAGWVPGTAVLVRRELLEQFPLDQQMGAYFEDNEWCYRVSLERPGCFRRCREALAFHHLAAPYVDLAANLRRIELLAAVAHFYRRHRVVLGPWTFDSVLPELRAEDGTCDMGSAKLLMELLEAKGEQWMLTALASGELDRLLSAHRQAAELERARSELGYAQGELERLRQAVAAQEQKISFLYERHLTLERVLSGGWWKLRGRLLPLVRLAGAARRALHGGDERPLA